jgi:hypothetical protein
LASTKILVGNGSGVATDVTLSGDATLSNTGALTIANNAITLAKLATGITPAYVPKVGGEIPFVGGSTSTTIPVVSAVYGDIPYVQFATNGSAAVIKQVSISEGIGISVTFTVDPGSVMLSYLLFKAAA